ncbi:MAG: hypothetical protein ABSB60_14270 [Terracidiphilus sp.]
MKAPSAILFIALLTPALYAQNTQAPAPNTADLQPTPAVHNQDGGVSEVLESIYIPPLVNAPFTAIVHTEWTRLIGDGGTWTVVNQRRVARDGQGRIYEERWLLVPKNGTVKSQNNVIQIADPNAHTLYNCFMLRTPHRCSLETFNESAQTRYQPVIGTTGPLPNHMGFMTHEDLGPRSIEGVETRGSRDTTTYNAGVMGNDQPFSTHREFWHSAQLGINLYSEVVNPSVGKQTFTLTDIALSEPDPSLFELPDGFTVADRRKPAAEPPQ